MGTFLQSRRSRSRPPGPVLNRLNRFLTGASAPAKSPRSFSPQDSAQNSSTPAPHPPQTSTRFIHRCYVYFDKPLVAEPLFEDDWILRINSWVWSVANALSTVDRVQMDTVFPVLFDPGHDRIRYLNLRDELHDWDGLPVAAFIFPIIRTD